MDPNRRTLLDPSLRFHLRCLRQDATDPAMSSLERLVLVRDRSRRIKGIPEEIKASDVRTV